MLSMSYYLLFLAVTFFVNIVSLGQEATSLAEQEALLSYMQNTVEVAKRFGPSVVAISVEGNLEENIEGFEIEVELDNLDFEISIPFLKEDSQGNSHFSLPWDKEEEKDVALALPENLEKDLREHLPEDFSLKVPEGTNGVIDFVESIVLLPKQLGSGFLVDEIHIITNYHLVRPALVKGELKFKEYANITVRFPNSDANLEIEVVGFHSNYDLALLKIKNPEEIPQGTIPLELGNSDALQVGQKAIVFGNPLNPSSSITTGIISALDAEMPSKTKINKPMIQIDADISVDSSGGPLLNFQGKVIGINTAVGEGYIPVLGNTSSKMGLVIPSNLIMEVLELLKNGLDT